MDVDIDFPTNFDLNSVIKHAIPASMVKNGELVKHNCGYYLQNIPVDPYTGVAAIPHRAAKEEGYFKIDFLHLSFLDSVKSKAELRRMIAKEPDWDLLHDPAVVAKLLHIHQYGDLLRTINPRSVQELADVLAFIRPGKRRLLQQYLNDREGTREELYRKDGDNYNFKRSHAISYALTIVAQLHLIARGVL